MTDERNETSNQIPSSDAYAYRQYISTPLMEPALCSAIQALQLPQGSQGLDAGCGIGLPTLRLAEAVGPAGHVTGIDLSPGFLAYAKGFAEKAGLSEQVSFHEGDVYKLPFNDNTFDWVWSSNCVGYPARQPVSSIKELARVIKPGGIVAILIYSSQQLLSGYPLLEARLNATSAGIAPFANGTRPELHPLRALGWFRDAGLKKVTAQTLVGDVHAPLSDDIRNALASLLDMRWEGTQSEVTTEDWAEYQRLCQPESPDFILNLPDYYAFFTYSLFLGKVTR